MRTLLSFVLLTSALVLAQSGPVLQPRVPPARSNTVSPAAADAAQAPGAPMELMVPAGTKVPLQLRSAISTKTARPGDPVYAQTNFPVAANNQLLIPAGTYVQGVIDSVKRAGRVKGRAEVLVHFNTLVFPNGYTVSLPAALDNVPGAEHSKMKDREGTVQQEGEKGKDAARIASTAATGAVITGASTGSLRNAGIGGLAGAGVGTAITLLTRGGDVRIEAGTVMEMVLQRDVPVDPAMARRRANMPTN